MSKFNDAEFTKLNPGIKSKVHDVMSITKEKDGKTKQVEFKKGLIFAGGTGIGKTYALYAVHNMFKGTPLKTKIFNWVELVQSHKDLIGNTDTNKMIDELIDCDVLILDDIGAEKATEWSTERLYMIIEKCYRMNRIVLLATNLGLTGPFQDQYGDRIFSRINEMCELVQISGEDRRIKKYKPVAYGG